VPPPEVEAEGAPPEIASEAPDEAEEELPA
jgi:hypothetical protein